MRLQKFLAHAGLCSRRKAEIHIAQGRVAVNGRTVTAPGVKVNPDTDQVAFRGEPVQLTPGTVKITIALNKPKGYVTTCAQDNARIVLELVDVPERLYPVGRLDKDSTGLLLLTNDGELHNRLSHPSFDHEKEYVVTTVRPISDTHLKAMASGMRINGQMTRKAKVRRLSGNRFKIVLKQGLNRQIRKMVRLTGNRVRSLKRIRMSQIRLQGLEPGQWRHLSRQELESLKSEN